MEVYKVLTAAEWAAFRQDGRFSGAPVDIADGFIHFSAVGQLAETLAKHFAGAEGLVLAAVNVAVFGAALRWEPSRGGALFPHLYRDLDLTEVLWTETLPLDAEGRHRLPARIGAAQP